jgi:hypothetical protein
MPVGSPAWRCEQSGRLHYHDATCTAHAPASDLIPDTPFRLRRFLQRSGTNSQSSQGSVPAPSKSRLRPQQGRSGSSSSPVAGDVGLSSPSPARRDGSIDSRTSPPSPGLQVNYDGDLPGLALRSSPATADTGDLPSQEQDTASELPSSPPVSQQPALQPRRRSVPQPSGSQWPPKPLPAARSATVEDDEDGPRASPTPASLRSRTPLPLASKSPRQYSPALRAQRHVNSILLNRLERREAEVDRLRTRNAALSARREVQDAQLRELAGENDKVLAAAEHEKERSNVLAVVWIATVLGAAAGGVRWK